MKGRQRPLPTEFTFAGFSFPRYIAMLPKGTKKQRQERYKHTGGYYTAPKPNASGKGFYLDEAGGLFTDRWTWCDEVNGARIDHTGWYCDKYQDDKIRGIVVRLPHGRFLAGWSMGEGMASGVEYDLYMDEVEAARAADSEAETVAEEQREYEEEQDELQRQEEENQGDDEEETEGY